MICAPSHNVVPVVPVEPASLGFPVSVLEAIRQRDSYLVVSQCEQYMRHSTEASAAPRSSFIACRMIMNTHTILPEADRGRLEETYIPHAYHP